MRTEQRATYQQLDAWMKQTLAYQSLDDAEIAFERVGAIETWSTFSP